MAVTKEAFVRYRIINECLLNKQLRFPSRLEIKEKIMGSLGLSSFSDRAFEKDLHDMRNDEELGFLAPIVYSKKEKGYYYTDDKYSIDRIPLSANELSSIRMASEVLEQYQNIPFLSQIKGTINKLSDLITTTKGARVETRENVVYFEEQQITKGGQFLGGLYQAIQNDQKVVLEYLKFGKNKPKLYTISPYLLKEYQGMWYVVAKIDEKDWRTFALDRIVNLEIKEEEYFIKEEGDEVNAFFKHVIGVGYSMETPEKVVVRIYGTLKNYLAVKPIHHSQELVKSGKGFDDFSFFLVPNHEFYAKLMQYLPAVKIKSPKNVQKKFTKLLKEGLKLQD